MGRLVLRGGGQEAPGGGGGDAEFFVCDLTAATASRTDVNTRLSAASVGDTVCVPAG